MFEYNNKIKNLIPYNPVTVSYAIRLDANESFVTPNEEIKEEILNEIAKLQLNRYPDPYAVEACSGFAQYFSVHPENIVAGNGSDELISIIMTVFLQKGDKVLSLSDDFSMYSFYTSLVDCKNIVIQKNDDYSVDIDKIINTANEKSARIIIFSNPCNPTGRVIKREDLRRLIKSVNSLVVLDEAYMDFSDESMLCEFANYDNLIILKTCSKAIGMAGIRLGFAIANNDLINVLKAAKSPYNVNVISQKICSVLFSHNDYIDNSIKRVLESRDSLYSQLDALSNELSNPFTVIKPHTNFVFMKYKDADKLHNYLTINSISVRFISGGLRITAGRNYENAELVNTIRLFLTNEIK
ncbi:MAG: histidinol-phosphate transaminase [Oscillospiraceae bacterium]